ncbi:MAG TPA: allophanate hydrolase subunit 1 [Streptosporangiaceae bacterium]|nr:allophanate hydrolase subunit 1 [Streptosporangiaceae bacterium]
MRFRSAGPSALLVEVDSLAQVRALHARIEQERAGGWAPALVDVIPAARTVLLDGVPDQPGLAAQMRSWSVAPLPPGAGREVAVPCHYDGPDLADVARQWGVAPGQVAAIHAALPHEVAFCGFAPGFPYIAGLGGGHEVARRDHPRAAVPAGSVALGDEYTGIYPRASPGGWQIIGRTDAVMWDSGRHPAALLEPGDLVRFVDVTAR